MLCYLSGKLNPLLKYKNERQLRLVTNLTNNRNLSYSAVIETDGPTLNTVLSGKRLFIGIISFRVEEHAYVKHCVRCLRPGKNSKECNCCSKCLRRHPEGEKRDNECVQKEFKRCMKCSGQHMAVDCNVSPGCFLCAQRHFNSEHRPYSPGCQTRKELMEDRLQWVDRSIDLSSEKDSIDKETGNGNYGEHDVQTMETQEEETKSDLREETEEDL